MVTSVPIVVVAGSLGSGKTSLLNSLLRSSSRPLGVIVNDFGDVNVDALTLGVQSNIQAGITGNCLCCITDTSQLSDAVHDLVGQGVDAIVVECSGLARPRRMVELIRGVAADRTHFAGLLLVVDLRAGAPGSTMPGWSQDDAQVASLIVANKADAVGLGRAAGFVIPYAAPLAESSLVDGRPWPGSSPAAQTLAELRTAAARAPIIVTEFGQIPLSLLLDMGEAPVHPSIHHQRPASEHDCAGESCTHDHHVERHGFTSVTVLSDMGCNPRSLVRFLENLPPGVVRAKGFSYVTLQDGSNVPLEVQCVGDIARITHAAEASPGTTAFVVIGCHMDDTSVREAVRNCLSQETFDDVDMAGLRRLGLSYDHDDEILWEFYGQS